MTLYFLTALALALIQLMDAKDSKNHFTLEDFDEFRDVVIGEIKAEQSGLTTDHPLVSFHDGMGPNLNPLAAALIRLIFHDCSGLNEEGNTKNAYVCNGCIKKTVLDHFGLYEGAIDPIEPICEIYAERSGLSRSDCWSLAATIAVEVTVTNHNALLDAFGIETTIGINPGDIPYLIGRKDCDLSPDDSANVIFHPFSAWDGWDTFSVDMKNRFNLANNREVVALLGGGHSLGRGHALISGFSSGWDISQEILDNDYFKTMINREEVANIVGLNLDFYQDTMDLNNGGRTQKQFLVDIAQHLRPLIVPITSSPKFFKYLNPDISLAFDLRKWVNNGLEKDITCHTDAYKTCLYMGYAPQFVLIDGYETQQIHDNYCPFKQCPLQCPDGNGGFNRFNDIVLNGAIFEQDPDSDCIRVFVEQFAINNQLFQQVFVDAFTNMIKTGYYKGNGDTKLTQIGNNNNTLSNHVYIYMIIASIIILLICNIVLMVKMCNRNRNNKSIQYKPVQFESDTDHK